MYPNTKYRREVLQTLVWGILTALAIEGVILILLENLVLPEQVHDSRWPGRGIKTAEGWSKSLALQHFIADSLLWAVCFTMAKSLAKLHPYLHRRTASTRFFITAIFMSIGFVFMSQAAGIFFPYHLFLAGLKIAAVVVCLTAICGVSYQLIEAREDSKKQRVEIEALKKEFIAAKTSKTGSSCVVSKTN